MSRAATPGGYLWAWDDNDNPGAGSKTVSKTAGGTGLNANFIEIENGLFTEHNANGTHKNDKIDGASLKSTVADGSTLEFSASSGAKVLRAKDGGLTLVKLSSTGAASGQSPIWNGSAIVWGNPAPTLADGSVTRTKMIDAAKPVTTAVLFGDVRVAGVSSGNAVAAETEWVEGATGAVKIEGFVIARAEDRFIRVICNALTSSGTRLWKVELLINDVVQATVTGLNTAYDTSSAREVKLSYAIASGSAVSLQPIKWGIKLTGTSPATASMKNVVVFMAGMDGDS